MAGININIDKQIENFTTIKTGFFGSNKTIEDRVTNNQLPQVNKDQHYVVSDEKFKKLIKFINDHLNDKTTDFRGEDFKFVQEILEQGLNNKKQQDELTNVLIGKCTHYQNNTNDLVSHIGSYLFNKLDPKCWANHVDKVMADNFKNANDEALGKLDKYIQNLSNNDKNLFLKKLTDKQIEELKQNKNFHNYTSLKNLVESSKSNTEELSMIVPTTESNIVPTKSKNKIASTSNLEKSSEKNKNQLVPISQTIKSDKDIDLRTLGDSEKINYINKYLNKLVDIDKIQFTKNEILDLGNNRKISAECFLYLFGNVLGEDLEFMKGKKCETYFRTIEYAEQKKIKGGNGSELEKMRLSTNNNFDQDTKFYQNLYGFIIAVADTIANGSEFKNAKHSTQFIILENFQKLIKNTIHILNEYMLRYNIISDKLINSGYNLLYLMNIIAIKRVNISNNIDKLISIYDNLVKAVIDNIEIYEKIDVKKIESITMTDEQKKLNDEVEDLIKKLLERIANLNEQKKKLETNVKNFNENTKNIKTMVNNDDIKNIAPKLEAEITKLKTEEKK